ncbi:putative F-box/LRR-repeat protein 22 [Lolium rigidum]|uniref:putative F-box/LRR-repeat protein 22 n=1 Tax=Lolium rigidum TaxID=89674 RepID=UPI001F5CCA1B|nr:putative F-box/LRR-repeat protein 22 [Lolium rigidum]
MPLLSPPPPPPARAPGCGRRRLSRIRRRRSKRAERSNWAELPLDALLQVLHRLDHVELMFGGAAKVCRSWHAAAREPELWRRVDMRGHSRLFREIISLDRMARLSIWFSHGQCQSFFGKGDVDDDLFLFLADQ